MKKYLKTFAAVAAGFATSQTTSANVNDAHTELHSPLKAQATDAIGNNQPEMMNIHDSAGDLFKFVMKRSVETGQLMAYHSSHASHSSHRSHYSSRY